MPFDPVDGLSLRAADIPGGEFEVEGCLRVDDLFIVEGYVAIDRQARLVAQWLGVGFIHGVMNTDNMSIAGETIDYGPCAFMESYSPGALFSSIDTGGRYAYQNQPTIARWNLARFAETVTPDCDFTP